MTLPQIQLVVKEGDRMEAQRDLVLVKALAASVHSLLDKEAGKNLHSLQEEILDRVHGHNPEDPEQGIQKLERKLASWGVPVKPMKVN